MDIALIAPYSDITSYGVRGLVSIIRNQGHTVTLIILNDHRSETMPDVDFQYRGHLLEDIYEVVSQSDLIGMSLMTLYYERMAHPTQFLKSNVTVPVIWGGIHPTIRPEESLQWADGIALGEADQSLVLLLEKLQKGHDITTTPGFWFRKEGELIKNDVIGPVEDLDRLPFPDYFPERQFFFTAENNQLQEVDSGVLKKAFEHNPIWQMGSHVYYQTMATRGCPYSCSYCCNSALRTLYQGNWKVRYRSPRHLVNELKSALETFSYISAIVLSDDSFFAYPLEQMQEFARLYKAEIGLPFRCLTSPLTLTRAKLELLLDCGLFSLQMGIQTGSERTKKLYRRSISTELILKATTLISEYKDRMAPPLYDFILDNPFETIDDCLATVKLVGQIRRPYILQLFSLVIFPGTELSELARDTISLDKLEGYQRPFNAYKPSYCTMLLLLYHHGMPLRTMKFLASAPLVRLMSTKPFHYLIVLMFWLYKKPKSIFTILSGSRR